MCATLFLNENAQKFTLEAPPRLALVAIQTLSPLWPLMHGTLWHGPLEAITRTKPNAKQETK